MLKIGGFVPFSTIDYPGYLSAVIFTQGCKWRCTYCHNSDLWPSQTNTKYSEPNILNFLSSRTGLLEAVVISGGEPLIQDSLPQFISSIKNLDYKVALHTGGYNADRFEKILPMLDWVGFDYKIDFPLYKSITQVPLSEVEAEKSLKLLIKSKVPYEVRTTWGSELFSEQVLSQSVKKLAKYGVQTFTLQKYRKMHELGHIKKPEIFNSEAISPNLLQQIEENFPNFQYRM